MPVNSVDIVDTIVRLVSVNYSGTYLFASDDVQCHNDKQYCKSEDQGKCERPSSVLALLRRTDLCEKEEK